MLVVGFCQVRFEAETFDQRQRRRFLRDEGIRTVFEQKAIALASLHNATNPVAGLKQGKVNLFAGLMTALE